MMYTDEFHSTPAAPLRIGMLAGMFRVSAGSERSIGSKKCMSVAYWTGLVLDLPPHTITYLEHRHHTGAQTITLVHRPSHWCTSLTPLIKMNQE